VGGAGARLWWCDPTQRWRLRYWRLWPGPNFDPADLGQAYTYAFQRLSKRERAVFALCRFEGLDYPDIARRLGLSVAAVERHLVNALYKMDRLLDLIDRTRGRRAAPASQIDEGRADR
jgi:DNA-directed RNA polymerase specialized sigma24 family protein